jgi:hypothetical protein
LLDGRVVFLTAAHAWNTDVNVAEVFGDETAAEAGIIVARASADNREVVDPYAIAVSSSSGRITPTLLRERIRAEGPTIVGAATA